MKAWLLRKLFIKLGFDAQLSFAYEKQIINSKQLHTLDAMFKRYSSAESIVYTKGKKP